MSTTLLPPAQSHRPITLTEAFALLRTPFPEQAIRWRLGALSEDETKGQAFPYVDGRHIELRLDEVFGAENWQRSFKEVTGGVLCRLSIRCGDEWVGKEDVSVYITAGLPDERSRDDVEKAYSDAFERAAATWGIARYLQSIDGLWVALTADKQFAEEPCLPLGAFEVEPLDRTGLEEGGYGRERDEARKEPGGYVHRNAASPDRDEASAGGARGGRSVRAVASTSTRSTPAVASRSSDAAGANEPECAVPIGEPEEWAALSQKEQDMAVVLVERIRKGVALASTEEYIVEGGGKSLPEWLRKELLLRLSARVGGPSAPTTSALAEVAASA